MKKIGILGGAFDPPHYGHLIMAEEVFNQLNLDAVWFIPTYESPHKSNSVTKPSHRLKLVEHAIKDNDHFIVNPIEIDSKGVSYSYGTITALKEKHKDTEFFFIIGGDMVEYLPKWHRIDELLKEVQFVGVTRPGFSLKTDLDVLEIKIPGIEISSSMLRERLKEKKTARYLTPDSVLKVIKELNLYE